jgi:hypothetical protein
MFDEIANLWSEDTDENIVKSWLVGITDGQTWSINEHFLEKITTPKLAMNFDCIEEKWDDIIGYKHDWKLDEEGLDDEVKRIVRELNELIADINANPDKYFYE